MPEEKTEMSSQPACPLSHSTSWKLTGANTRQLVSMFLKDYTNHNFLFKKNQKVKILLGLTVFLVPRINFHFIKEKKIHMTTEKNLSIYPQDGSDLIPK